MNYEDVRKLVPQQYKQASFDGDLTLDFKRAQSPDTELWLFQFPPQITTEDFAQSGLKIPPQSKLTQAGKHVQIGTFTIHGIRYVLSEAPADSVQNMVNFWSSDEDMDNGVVYRGKPFHRLFIATIDVASNLMSTRQVIDAVPMGANKPFIAKPIQLPKGLKNPWDETILKNGKKSNHNIIKQLESAPFNFTSGNFDATMNENVKWVGDADVYESHYSKPIVVQTKKQKKEQQLQQQQQQQQQQSTKQEKQDKKQEKQEKKQEKSPQPTQSTQPTPKKEIKVEIKQEENKKQKQSRELTPPQTNDDIQQQSKKQKNNIKKSTEDDQQLVQLGKTQPQESKKSKRDKKDKKDIKKDIQ